MGELTRPVLELVVASPDEAELAVACGADRLELACAPELGGLTPSAGLMRAVRARVRVPVWALVRPRAGGFVYSAGEHAAMLADVEALLAAGADGVVTGALTGTNRVDRARCRELAGGAPGRAAFHRAFDLVPDQLAALDELAALGFVRVLTSGGAPTALAGAARLAELVRANRVGVLAGGGVRAAHAGDLVRASGVAEVHAGCRTLGPPGPPGMGDSTALDGGAARALRAALDRRAGP